MTGRRNALIIANGEYTNPELQRLLSPAADADALARVLGDPVIGEFSVDVIRNEPSHTARERIEGFFGDCRTDDLLLLHYSGHGLKSDSGELFFSALDTRPTRLRSTAIPAQFVQECMRTSPSRRIVLLLDCCFGGAFQQGAEVRAGGNANVLDAFPTGTIGGRGRAVITASGSMEYAFEGSRLGVNAQQAPSVFTAALVEGLATGDADRDEDGLVSLSELYDYVYDRVRSANPKQTPSKSLDLQGELYLARSRRRRIRPQPIPADVRSALFHESMYARIGAINELRTLLSSDKLEVAAGARDSLQQVIAADIEHVAGLAATALESIRLRPADTTLSFGTVIQGSTAPHRVVKLLGPPLARVCTPRVTQQWLAVTETEGGLDISIDTSTAGSLEAQVILMSPTNDEAIINIRADIIPQTIRRPVRQTAASADDAPKIIVASAKVVRPSQQTPTPTPTPTGTADMARGNARPAGRLGPIPLQTASTSSRDPLRPITMPPVKIRRIRTRTLLVSVAAIIAVFGVVGSLIWLGNAPTSPHPAGTTKAFTGTQLKALLVTTIPPGFVEDTTLSGNSGDSYRQSTIGQPNFSCGGFYAEGEDFMIVAGVRAVSFAYSYSSDEHGDNIFKAIYTYAGGNGLLVMSRMRQALANCPTFSVKNGVTGTEHVAVSTIPGLGDDAVRASVTSPQFAGGITYIVVRVKDNIVAAYYDDRTGPYDEGRLEDFAPKIVANVQAGA